MSTEEKLKDLILRKYHSIREFTTIHDIPYTTIHSIFRRGVGNSSVSNIIKICKALGISADALAEGRIVLIDNRIHVSTNDRIEIKEILDDTKKLLSNDGFVTLDGKLASKESIDTIIDAINVGVELAEKKSK